MYEMRRVERSLSALILCRFLVSESEAEDDGDLFDGDVQDKR